MITVELQNVAPGYKVPSESSFQTWAQAFETHPLNIQEINQIVALRIVDEKEIMELNALYRKKQGATNVLSFPSELHEDVNIPFMGDVVICAPVVIKEALKQGKTEQSHWAHMTVHGILHLQGYDHENDADAEQMESIEIQIMSKLGFENPYI